MSFLRHLGLRRFARPRPAAALAATAVLAFILARVLRAAIYGVKEITVLLAIVLYRARHNGWQFATVPQYISLSLKKSCSESSLPFIVTGSLHEIHTVYVKQCKISTTRKITVICKYGRELLFDCGFFFQNQPTKSSLIICGKLRKNL